ncbi:MAG: toprim domain-containing protein [bacterium]|nr:toprim domain-containing protein [bacterium]
MGSQLVDISDIAEMLNQRIGELTRELLPGGRRDGHEWRCGSVAGEPGGSMAVKLVGAKCGVWSDFSSGECGDALDLVSAVLFHGDKGEAVKWSRSWLGLDNLDPARLEQRRREAKVAADKRDKDAAAEALKMRNKARAIFIGAQPDIIKTPVYRYLLLRGIDINVLPKVPGSLRFEPNCWCMETKTELPAMVACVQDGDGQHIATHRTYLQRQHDGTWKKAPLEDAKKTLGSFRGGFITLNRGASGKPLRQAPEGDHVFLAEGIETGLSLAVEMPEVRVLAGVSVSNFANLALPAACSSITIAADNDGDNAQAKGALDRAVERFIGEGRSVRVIHSPVGKDFNDLLQWQKRAVIEAARRMS